jgi:SAM-dependent methyltransferase
METSFKAPSGLKRRFGETWLNPLHLARRSLRAALAAAPPQAHGRLLDVGCGGQRYRLLFRNVDAYLGVDLPSNSADNRNLDAFADGLHLPFPTAAFDTVLCTEVLEHVPEPLVLLTEVARVLCPGGLLILTTPQTWGLHEVPHDYYRYTEYGLRYLAGRAGLNVLVVEPTCGVWATAGQRVASFLFFSVSAGWPLPAKALLAGLLVPWQLIAAGLDALFQHRGDTLDNLLLAKKP